MRYCKLNILIIVAASVVYGISFNSQAGSESNVREDVKAITEASTKISKNIDNIVNISDFEGSDEDVETVGDIYQLFPGAALKADIGDSENGLIAKPESAQEKAWAMVEKSIASPNSYMGDSPPHPEVPDDVMYVYISLSMPISSLSALFGQALARPDNRNIVFVLRGWKPPHLQSIVQELNSIFPEAKKSNELPNVQINPNLFRDSQITRVPVFQKKSSQGVWRIVKGATSINDAINRLESNDSLSTANEYIGETYTIVEPDIVALMEQRISQHDWSNDVERIKQNLYSKHSGLNLPSAIDDKSYLVNLSIKNVRDLTVDGEIFAPSGMLINPLDHITLSRKYIFFNATLDSHINQAEKWINENDSVLLITSVPIKDGNQRALVSKRLGQRFFDLDPLLAKRFDLKEVPSLAYQDGNMLRIDVVAVSN